MGRIVFVSWVSLALPACYLPPACVANPPPSVEGVSARLVADDCEDGRGLESEPVSAGIAVRVELENPTDETLRVDESAIRMFVEDDRAGVMFPGEEMVPPDSVRTVTLDFVHHASCDPNRSFMIAWNGAFRLGRRYVAVAPTFFSP